MSDRLPLVAPLQSTVRITGIFDMFARFYI